MYYLFDLCKYVIGLNFLWWQAEMAYTSKAIKTLGSEQKN